MSGNLIQANSCFIPLKDKSVQLCAFSPPYWGLRSYKIDPVVFGGDSGCEHEWGNAYKKIISQGYSEKSTLDGFTNSNTKGRILAFCKEISQSQFCQKCDAWRGQLGLEPSIDLFLDHMMLIMAEVWRVLRDDGVCFVNIGDSFAGSGKGQRGDGTHSAVPGDKQYTNKGASAGNLPKIKTNIKPKSLCLIPQKFAIRCQEAGWIVRSEIIWHKPNPMPESCKDRPTKAHEQVWMLTKQGKYFWDQEGVKESPQRKVNVGWKDSDLKEYSCDPRLDKQGTYKDWRKYCPTGEVEARNIRSVWTLSTEPSPEAHFATFPSKLVEIMIRAGSSPKACEICGAPWKRIIDYRANYEKRGAAHQPGNTSTKVDSSGWKPPTIKILGWQPTCKCDNKGTGKCIILDPFAGTATTVLVAEKLGRIGIGLDLSSEYLWDIAKKKVDAPMQKEIF